MKKTILLLLFGTMFFSASAMADTVYTYSGNPFTNFDGSVCSPGCGLSGFFSLADPLTPNTEQTISPVAYDFTDGLNTFTNTNSYIGSFDITTTATGIDAWDILLYNPTTFLIYSSNNPTGGSNASDMEYTVLLIVPDANNSDAPGTWSTADPVATPEPATSLLLGIGLLGLWGSAARSKRLPSPSSC